MSFIYLYGPLMGCVTAKSSRLANRALLESSAGTQRSDHRSLQVKAAPEQQAPWSAHLPFHQRSVQSVLSPARQDG